VGVVVEGEEGDCYYVAVVDYDEVGPKQALQGQLD